MGCACSSPADSEDEPDEITLLSAQHDAEIERVSHEYEERISTLRQEVDELREAYQSELASTTTKRMPKHAGGQGDRSLKQVNKCQDRLKEAERRHKQEVANLRYDLADMRAQQRADLDELDRRRAAGDRKPLLKDQDFSS